MPEDLSSIATELLYEDDHVRIWNQVVPSGADIARHRHEHDYFLLNVAGTGPIDVEFHEGTGGSLGEHFSFNPTPGRADYIEKGHIETAHNKGDEYRAVLVELKRP